MSRYEKVKRFFRNNLISGTLVVLPLVASIYVLIKISRWLYQKLVILQLDLPGIRESLTGYLPEWAIDTIVAIVHPAEFALVIFLIILITTLIGLFTKVRVINWMFEFGARIFENIPLVGMVYTALKQLLQAIFSGKGNFSQVVMVEYPKKDIWCIGFLSREADSYLSGKAGEYKDDPDLRLLSIFIPTTPNPTSGFLLMIPEDQVVRLDITIEQAFKIIISAGMVLPHEEIEDTLSSGKDLRKTFASSRKNN